MAFDVANKIKIKLFAELERLKRQFVALRFLSSDAENADTRFVITENLAGVNAAHDGIMCQINWFAFDVGPGIEQHKFVVGSRNNGSDTPAIDSRQATELESGGSK